ncbi:MAG: hypothetical protein R6X21_09205 [Candidatus Aminicenantes bacterium]
MLECGSLHLDDSRLAEIFAREVLGLLVNKGLLSPDGMGGTDPQLAAFRAHPSAHPPAGSQAGSSLRIEDVEVRIAAPQAGEPRAASGPLNRLLSEYWAPRSGKAERGDFAVDEEDSVSGVRSLRTEKAENGPMSTGVQ